MQERSELEMLDRAGDAVATSSDAPMGLIVNPVEQSANTVIEQNQHEVKAALRALDQGSKTHNTDYIYRTVPNDKARAKAKARRKMQKASRKANRK